MKADADRHGLVIEIDHLGPHLKIRLVQSERHIKLKREWKKDATFLCRFQPHATTNWSDLLHMEHTGPGEAMHRHFVGLSTDGDLTTRTGANDRKKDGCAALPMCRIAMPQPSGAVAVSNRLKLGTARRNFNL